MDNLCFLSASDQPRNYHLRMRIKGAKRHILKSNKELCYEQFYRHALLTV